MASSTPHSSTGDARRRLARQAWKAQGLLSSKPFGRGIEATRRALEHLGYIQIDTLSVVARAHHHSLWNRVPNYRPQHLDHLLENGNIFEYWYHAASYLPMRDYRYALPRMQAFRDGSVAWARSRDKKLMRRVLQRIQEEGPLQARDFDDIRTGKSGWWDWKPTKRALEQLFMQGDLMISGRIGFQKIYDLRERVLPSHIDRSTPSIEEYAAYLIDTSLRAHSVTPRTAFSYGRRGMPLRRAIDAILAQRVAEGSLIRVNLEKDLRPTQAGSPMKSKPKQLEMFTEPDTLNGKMPRAPHRMRVLSPFDNAVILRVRNLALHGFDYQLECYLPEAKRRFGYFCLPLLYGDSLIGRMDCKAHRSAQPGPWLEVKHLHLEHPLPRESSEQTFVDAFQSALLNFAEFNACERVGISSISTDALRSSWGRAAVKTLTRRLRALF